MNLFLQYLFSLSLTIILVQGFNIDLGKKGSYSGRSGEYFGYSTTFHSNKDGKWLLVGAPLSNFGEAKATFRPGHLFKCRLPSNASCEKVDIKDAPVQQEHKDRQWRGMNVLSQGPSQGIFTCTPRRRGLSGSTITMYGHCDMLDGDTFTVKAYFQPCYGSSISLRAYCQAGFSVAGIWSSPQCFALGLPGAEYATGTLAVIDIQKRLMGETHYKSVSSDRLKGYSKMGFSMTWGYFTNSPRGELVGGAPTANNMKGRVLMYSVGNDLQSTGEVLENPEQKIGSFFGGTVTAIDLNNDGKSDLLVGAPMYSFNYDEGKVYLYLNNGNGGMTLITPHIASDKRPGARFGTSIVPIGDINLDGYQDFAIGAPYGGSSGHGAVYIFNGGPSGLKNGFKTVQVIDADDVRGGLRGFGGSIAGNMDIDDNGYPDVAVGSFMSDHVHYIHSRPVLRLSGTLHLNNTKVSTTSNNTWCTGPDKKKYTCIKLDACLTYKGRSVPNISDTRVVLTLDKNHIGKRRASFFTGSNVQEYTKTLQLTLKKDIKQCRSFVIHADVHNLDDVLAPVVIFMEYFYITPKVCAGGLCPVIDKYMGTSAEEKLFYLKGCGDDDICTTDLVVNAAYTLEDGQTEFVYGVQKTLVITANIKNDGENSFLTKLYVDFPKDFQFVSVESSQSASVFWDIDNTKRRLTLPLGSPFAKGQKVTVKAKFSPAAARPSVREQKFVVKTDTGSKESKPSDNEVTLKFNAAISADLTVTGTVTPDIVYYNKDKPKNHVGSFADIGPQVNFTFLVQNKGPSPVEKFVVSVRPTNSFGGEHLLYTLDVKIDDLPCNGAVNPLNLTANGVKTGNRRKRRDIDVLNCRTGTCGHATCKVDRMEKGDHKIIHLSTRLWLNTLKASDKGSYLVLAKAVIDIGSPEILFLRQPENSGPDVKEVFLRVSPIKLVNKTKTTTPWWIFLLAALGGLLLLTIPTIILYKKGFFKRDRRIKEITGPEGGAETHHSDQM